MDSPRGIIFDIKKFSIHDGPGIRTTIFLKGCPLHCSWCHNPEGISPLKEIQFWGKRCIGCHECIEACEIEDFENSYICETESCDDLGYINPCKEHSWRGE